MRQPIIIGWALSSFSGWGVYGIYLALHWALDGQTEAIGTERPQPKRIAIDPLRLQALKPFFERTARFHGELQKHANGRMRAGMPVLTPLGNTVEMLPVAENVLLEGDPTIGNLFFEKPLDTAAVERAKRFALIITGSSWNERLLRGYGIDQVKTVFQGVDPTVFHPAPNSGIFANRFLIFSGGKAEFRKSQDIVLAAFRIFAERHPEALLVTAWQSPWPKLARALDRSGIAAPVVLDANGRLDVAAWAAANRIATDCILDLGTVPNILMPLILREMNVAVFPNRAEGGTNLVAMECMACGLPVILSRNTGHLDLIEDDNCYPLEDQRQTDDPWAGTGLPGWGESQIDEVVARLEEAFSDSAGAKRRGERAAQTLSRRTWAETARQLSAIMRQAATA